MYHVCYVYDIYQKDIQETVLVCVLRGRVEYKPEDWWRIKPKREQAGEK